MAALSKTSLKHKLYGLNIFYLILLGTVVFFFFSYNSLIRNLSDTQERTSVLAEATRTAALSAKDHLASRIDFEQLESAFQPLLQRAGAEGLDADVEGVWNDLRSIHDIRVENARIETEIQELTAHSIAQSNGYIEQVSQKLADPRERYEVSQLERLVIIGASVNTSSSYELRLLFNRLKESLDAKDPMLDFLDTLLANVEKDIEQLSGTPFEDMAQEAKKANLRVQELVSSYIENVRQANTLEQNVFQDLEAAMAQIRRAEIATSHSFIERVKGYFQVIVAVLIVTSLLGVALSLVLARSLSRTLERIITNLSGASDQISSASDQVSASSQDLAEGASEQAASVEETSSSLEEISSMTRRNAENAQETSRIMMQEAAPNFQTINARMEEMKAAIEKTVANSDETAKIVKTIDEIAFQTNLLALNAAVEAARAGEAGAGFAVVADEVRNLALRAAEAAKNTSELIHASNGQIKDAAELNAQVVVALESNTDIAQKVGKLIGEVAAASDEQAQGIDQISKAVAEMDKATQQNAASAEESASASEEMNAQAREMEYVVRELLALTAGRKAFEGKHALKGEAYGKTACEESESGRSKKSPAGFPQASRMLPQKDTKAKHPGEVPPEQVIPLEDKFKDF